MYIQPNTNIRLLKDVPLDKTYDHTIYFKDYYENNPTYHNKSIGLLNQSNYFKSFTKYLLTEQTYQRVFDGKMRVGIPADSCYDCNYIMFQNIRVNENVNYEKWFYAFITSINYVNETTCEIEYQLDVMQSWYFDYELAECFVSREHSEVDYIGSNIVEENLELGEYIDTGSWRIYDTLKNPEDPDAYRFLIISAQNPDGTQPQGTDVCGLYSGLSYSLYKNLQDLRAYLATKTEADRLNILGIYPIPQTLTLKSGDVGQDFSTLNGYFNVAFYGHSLQQTGNSIIFPYVTANHSTNSYIPKNAKLGVYPYRLMHFVSDGGSCDYKYEYFRNPEDCRFLVKWSLVPQPTVSVEPMDYRYLNTEAGSSQNQQELRISLSDFPSGGVTSDVYKVYMAQNQNQLPLKMLGLKMNFASTILPTFANAVAGNVAGTISGGANMLSSALNIDMELAKQKDLHSQPNSVNGTQTTISDYTFGYKEIYYHNLQICGEYAEMIDNYFTMFGYATKIVKIPNVKNPNAKIRPYWNYIKTVGCDIHGSIPADDCEKICSIYNNGITFWVKNENSNPDVGNYSQDNSPIQ